MNSSHCQLYAAVFSAFVAGVACMVYADQPETYTNRVPRIAYRPVVTNKVMNSDGSFTTFYANSALFSRRQYRTGDMEEVYTNGLIRKTFWRRPGSRLFSKRLLKNNLIEAGVWYMMKTNMMNTVATGNETLWDEWADSTTLEEDNQMIVNAFQQLRGLGLSESRIEAIKAASVAE